MNRVTRSTPLETLLGYLDADGYVLMEDALSPIQLDRISEAYERVLAANPPRPEDLRVEVKRALELDPSFEQLIDHPATFGVAHAVIGYDIELATGGELDCKLPCTRAFITWHNDFQWMTNVPCPRQNYWIRCTYFISDVTDDMGPFTLLPGTHLRSSGPPAEYSREGQPMSIEDQVRVVGPAGSCLINNTELWHTNTPNESDAARKLFMVLYKHAWMKPWQDGYELSQAFAARQTDPLRRQLCGSYTWHQPATAFPAHRYVDKREDPSIPPENEKR